MGESFQLIYSNEDDRAYGLAGMAIAIASLDALDKIAEVSIDSEGPMVEFLGSYYYAGSPSVSPKATWNNLIRNFHLTTTMAVGNVLARSVVRLGSEIPADAIATLRDIVEAEGRDTCSLEEEETNALFDRVLMQTRRIFYNPRMHPAVRDLATVISRRRRLSGLELSEQLAMLQL